jgi:hypothetical protein
VKGSNYSTYAPFLVKAGFNSTGNQILYNGMTGEQIQSDIYIGPTYYMRLKHMVKDKINYRATGPRTNLTRQTVQGRANDGGLRIGEMERDGVLAHGMSYFLNESFMIRGDEYFMAICNKTGAIAIYNEIKNLFLSPFADGPVNFHTNPDGSMNVQNISKFGRSFSLVRIPFSFKLLIQELQTMNIQMRIITDENVDQMLSLSYSNNIDKLLNNSGANDISATEGEDYENSNNNLKMNIVKLKSQIKNALTIPVKNDELSKMETTINEIDSEEQEEKEEKELPYIPIDIKPAEAPDTGSQESVPYAPGSPAYESPTNSEEYQPGSSSPYMPDMDSETSPILIKRPQQEQTTGFNPMTPSDSPPRPTLAPEEKKTILEVEEKKEEPLGKGNSSEGSEGNNNENSDSTNGSSSNETKKIII